MKTALIALAIVLSSTLSAQDLTIAAGATKTLTPGERTLTLKKLTIGDNATIIIPADMTGWTVNATDVTIGTNVKIVGNVVHGSHGPSGMMPASSGDCRQGMTGSAAGTGLPGTAGKIVSLNLKIKRIGTLIIDVKGGNGGNGGNGGGGGRGGNATCSCNAGNGGYGAPGGRGGNGGGGGGVSIVYSKIGNASVSNSNFQVVNTGGVAGTGGNGGQGGQGGAGISTCGAKSAARPAGQAGLNGARGANGSAGRNGTITITAQ